MPVALAAGIVEAWAGVLVLVPRWRRWGAWLCGIMLVAFMVYFAVFYDQLRGADCSCFPWLKRVVGPGFFISDAAMLALAVFAGLWTQRSHGAQKAALILGICAVFSGVVYGVTITQQSGLEAPDSIVVDGKPYSLRHGRVFLFFFDPECSHCDASAKELAKWQWNNTRVIAVSTVNPHWGDDFLQATKLEAGLCLEPKPLRDVFKFTDPPYGVALEHGRQLKAFPFFDNNEPRNSLKQMGWLE